MTENISMDFLHPDHLEDPRKSRLSDETILKAGIKSVSSRDIPKKLGFDIPGLISMYEIPYPGCDGYSRFKAFYADGERYYKDGSEKPKYLARKDSGNRLYIPYKVTSILKDVSIPLYITEGEKKSLKATQEGLPCIGISGLWNWGRKTENGYELLPDFDQFALEGRTVYLVPDSDWQEPNREGKPKNLKQAVHELAYCFIDRGSRVDWVELPQEGDEKVGLDDYLCSHTVEDFKKLPIRKIRKLTINEMIADATPEIESSDLDVIIKGIARLGSETEKALYVNRLHEKTNIPVKAIRDELKTFTEYQEQKLNDENIVILHPSYAIHPGKQCLLLGFKETYVLDGKTEDRNMYLVSTNSRYVIIDDGNTSQIETNRYVFDVRDRVLMGINERWDKKKLRDFVSNPTSVALYQKIKHVVRSYIELQNESYYGLVSAWIMATYFHRCFNAFPFLFFYGKKGSGKSRILDLLEKLCFNAIKVKGITVASLADSLDGLRGTFLCDQAESLSNPQNEELVGILADSYTVGGGKRRLVHISNKNRRVLEFETYSPKAFASFKDIHPDLKDRCVQISMLRAVNDFPYPEAHLPVWSELRDELYRMLLTNWKEAIKIYQHTGDGVTHRVGELWRPLETILKHEKVSDLEIQEIKNAFLESMKETQAELTDFEHDLFEALLAMLKDIKEGIFTVSEIAKKMESYSSENDKKFTTWVGKSINQLSLFTKNTGRTKKQRSYLFQYDHVQDVFSRYHQTSGFSGSVVNTQQNQGVSTTTEKNSSGNQWSNGNSKGSDIPLIPLNTTDQKSSGRVVSLENQGKYHYTTETTEIDDKKEISNLKELVI